MIRTHPKRPKAYAPPLKTAASSWNPSSEISAFTMSGRRRGTDPSGPFVLASPLGRNCLELLSDFTQGALALHRDRFRVRLADGSQPKQAILQALDKSRRLAAQL